jgi:hypothetical protein
MKYFQVIQETDNKIIGRHPQLKDLKIDFHKAKASQWAKVDSWKSEEDLPDLNQFLLNPKSKLTDSMSNNFILVSSGMIISKKLREIFEKFRIYGEVKTATIHAGKIKHEYYLQWYEYGTISKINWNISKFIEFYNTYNKESQKYGDSVKLLDFEDYKVRFKNLLVRDGGSLWNFFPQVLSFNDHPHDLVSAFHIGLIISEPLKFTLEENNITGLKYKEIESRIVWNNETGN